VDRDVNWWAEVVFGGWRGRPGPRYQRLATALVDAVQDKVVPDGTRVPAERSLAAGLGVSRGTVVACFDHLVAAGVLRHRQGSGTFVVGRPSWTEHQPAGSVATLLLRRMAAGGESIDLSVSVPGTLGHLPPVDLQRTWGRLGGHGLDPVGLPELRERIAAHLSTHQRLPTGADQVIVTAGAQEALLLVGRALRTTATPVLTVCPTYPGLAGAFSGGSRRPVPVAGDAAGVVPPGVERALDGVGAAVLYLAPTGHNPTGTVVPAARREALAALADGGRCTVVEDLALADLYFDEVPPAPVAARSRAVVAVGSVSKLLWAGLLVGWIRADGDLRQTLVAHKAAASLATSAPAQLLASELLGALDTDWLEGHRRALAARRDHLAASLSRQLLAWRIDRPAAGLSLWAELPVLDADAFAHVANRHGVTVAPGSMACIWHRHGIRLSFAEPLETLDLAVERLCSAWEAYSEDVAASPGPRRPLSASATRTDR
jgi:DNA-binding transcriptional MocR family regulator